MSSIFDSMYAKDHEQVVFFSISNYMAVNRVAEKRIEDFLIEKFLFTQKKLYGKT